MDSTEFNKIAGGLIGAFLLFLLLNFATGKIYGTGEAHHGEEPLGFALEVDDADAHGGEEKKAEATDYSALVANANVANGEKIFRKCKTCHKVEDGVNGIGPSLWGVVGRDIASIDGFGYSGALTGLEGNWDLTKMGEFLKSPKDYASGTKMSFGGIKDAQDRVDLIAYLNEADGTPIKLAAAAPADDAKADDAKADDAKADEHGDKADGDATTDEDAKKAEEAKAAEEAKKAEEAKAAEEAKKAEEAKAAEDAKKAEEAKAAEEAKKADEAKAAEEAKKAEEAKAAEEAKKAEEAKAAEEAKKAEEAKAAEEAKKAEDEAKTEVAAADPNKEDTAAAPAGETAAAFAGGDAAAGKKVFRKCKACHKLEEGKKGVGPSLYGVINRDIASVEGFSYSKVLQGLPGNWTASKLAKFLAGPRKYAKGTKMSFAGLKKEKDIVNLLTFLNEADGSPDPLQ